MLRGEPSGELKDSAVKWRELDMRTEVCFGNCSACESNVVLRGQVVIAPLPRGSANRICDSFGDGALMSHALIVALCRRRRRSRRSVPNHVVISLELRGKNGGSFTWQKLFKATSNREA